MNGVATNIVCVGRRFRKKIKKVTGIIVVHILHPATLNLLNGKTKREMCYDVEQVDQA